MGTWEQDNPNKLDSLKSHYPQQLEKPKVSMAKKKEIPHKTNKWILQHQTLGKKCWKPYKNLFLDT